MKWAINSNAFIFTSYRATAPANDENCRWSQRRRREHHNSDFLHHITFEWTSTCTKWSTSTKSAYKWIQRGPSWIESPDSALAYVKSKESFDIYHVLLIGHHFSYSISFPNFGCPRSFRSVFFGFLVVSLFGFRNVLRCFSIRTERRTWNMQHNQLYSNIVSKCQFNTQRHRQNVRDIFFAFLPQDELFSGSLCI